MLGRRPLGTFAVIAVVAAVVIAPVYYFQVLGPKRRVEGQRGEARTWLQGWQAARDCVLGGGPGTSPTERVLVREIEAGAGVTATCHVELDTLEKTMVGATGNPALDRVWRRVNQGTRTFVTRARTFGSDLHPPDKKREGLADIVAELDGLAAELARTAGLDAPAPLATREVPELPDGLLLHDTRGLPAQLIWWFPEGDEAAPRRPAMQQAAGVLALTVVAPDGVEVIVVRGPDDITHVPIPEGSAPATGGDWAAVLGEGGGLQIAALDPDGRPVADGAREVARPGRDELLPPLYALGTATHRAILYGRRALTADAAVGDVRVVASEDDGQSWTERWHQPPGAAPLLHASWVEPRAYLSYAGDGGNLWLPITETTLTTGLTPHRLPLATPSHLSCTSNQILWLLAERVLRAPISGATAPAPVDFELPDGWHRFACTDDDLAVYVPGPRDATVVRCNHEKGCGSPWQVTAGGPMALSLGATQGIIAANTVGDFLVLWRLEDGTYSRLSPVRIYRAPGMEVVALSEWSGSLYALVTATDSGDLHLIPIEGEPSTGSPDTRSED